jgi:hypothetical protein
MCIMEATAYVAGEPHSDHPACVSPVIAAFARTWNDRTDEVGRDRLIPLIPRLIGTVDPALEQRRAFVAADAAVRVFAPAALRAAGLTAEADQLAGLGELVDEASAWSARSSAESAARSSAESAAESAESAAWSAAWSAESAASAARSAARSSAAWSAASAARSAASAARSAESAARSAAVYDLVEETFERLILAAYLAVA